jgi:hypothetical protein
MQQKLCELQETNRLILQKLEEKNIEEMKHDNSTLLADDEALEIILAEKQAAKVVSKS